VFAYNEHSVCFSCTSNCSTALVRYRKHSPDCVTTNFATVCDCHEPISFCVPFLFAHAVTWNSCEHQLKDKSQTQSRVTTGGQSVSKLVSQSVFRSVSQSVTQSVGLSVSQSISQSACLSASQSISLSVSQPVSPSFSQSVSPSWCRVPPGARGQHLNL